MTLMILFCCVKIFRCLVRTFIVNPRQRDRETTNPTLHLKIYSGTRNYVFKLLSFSTELSTLHIIDCPRITNIYINTARTGLIINWSGPLTYTILQNERCDDLPSLLTVPWLMRSQVFKCITADITALVLLKSAAAKPIVVSAGLPTSTVLAGNMSHGTAPSFEMPPDKSGIQSTHNSLDSMPSAPLNADHLSARKTAVHSGLERNGPYRGLIKALQGIASSDCTSEKA